MIRLRGRRAAEKPQKLKAPDLICRVNFGTRKLKGD